MSKKLTKAQFIEMLKAAAAIIEERHPMLSKLDEATGDGDHGVTILRTMRAVTHAISENSEKPLSELIKSIAMKIMMCDGGSTSPLLGSYFLGLATKAPDDELTSEQTANMFEAGLVGFKATSKAEPGNKTMMDAFAPATEALVGELRKSGEIETAFSLAAEKAAEGAEKTKAYVAKFGRARLMGERSIGHLDPGATSISFLFEGFATAL
ncbi:dihydroxyacetone kinase subunit DhaL [Pseudovibrio sp. Tun.PSC04-5.I4]|uniref:dihydroxyacetone kinase subunit DhaL n=1 Tax=Pseudovibrio sp. Tun.PSC04-5.I4 TaxID=1798213 RepID=UPI00117B3234|nr:dihydroxyacetone kinase subunit DhaL [Pseudovibrio sp. Tun.PSC04-5.I4]